MSAKNIHKKLVGLNQLKIILKKIRATKQKIVFTNGCFDVVHTGHLESLKNAKELGDVLIVGLNSDESVRRLRGETRPINSLEKRSDLLLKLRYVDYLTVFSEATATNLIKIIRPDVYAKGGTHTIDTLPEAPAVKAYGGIIKIFPYVNVHSSREIIRYISTQAREKLRKVLENKDK